jgi:hypothetical protein
MRKLLSLGMFFLSISAITWAQSGRKNPAVPEGMRGRFVGAWRLVSLESESADGKIHRSDSTGLLVFTSDGHMSVQVMDRNPQPQTAAGPELYSQGGYEASFGAYPIDASASLSTWKALWCGLSSEKTCREPSNSRAKISSLSRLARMSTGE